MHQCSQNAGNNNNNKNGTILWRGAEEAEAVRGGYL